ncbi:MAG: DUF1287 domain-containing protein [Candidatus Eremiobacteraeota bacterium]|nr:DUF1287 domain-containing protein [Candidatus Eremiobacteraeota bacterium]
MDNEKKKNMKKLVAQEDIAFIICEGNIKSEIDSPVKTKESSVKFKNKTDENKVKLTNKQKLLLEGARLRLGDEYDASYYSEGHPPDGKSACVDVVYYAYKKIGVNLQKKVNADLRSNPGIYPAKGDYAINHRRCPNLIVWFRRFTKSLDRKSKGKSLSGWKPGDVVFWSLTNDGVADHCGIISDKKTDDGVPLAIHQFPPECKEEDVLNDWVIMGHFRW